MAKEMEIHPKTPEKEAEITREIRKKREGGRKGHYMFSSLVF